MDDKGYAEQQLCPVIETESNVLVCGAELFSVEHSLRRLYAQMTGSPAEALSRTGRQVLQRIYGLSAIVLCHVLYASRKYMLKRVVRLAAHFCARTL